MVSHPSPRLDAPDRERLFPSVADGAVLDEAALIVRVRAGDVEAFEALFKQYYGPLWRAALAYVGVPEMAKECVQDVMIWVWDHCTQWPFDGSLTNYLYRAVRNHALNRLRSQRVRERWAQRATNDLSISGMSQGPESPDRLVRSREISAALAQAMAELPDRRREAFALRYQHGLSNAGVAEVMGVSTKCIEVHLAKAIQVLRVKLKHLR